ncbi:MAG: hypothetical protein E6H03_05355 [Bacillati bacterium ANGP1]|uniref:Uncharacterized protein n=1 Tax=Candidatus Segetimicrobium genomatis TaxID=2569760 RepID=A0A537JGB6_9BACT|nr:MAG: hypothetical protein E6H03_05355 [Terrabacteria group bacterium ANGP1]
MTRRLEFWELTACGAAAGGTGVWGLAAAPRVGWLRAFLDLFPHSSWDALTWVLIPILLLLSPAAQGAIVARLAAPRPAPVWRGVAGSVAGTLLVLLAASALALALIRRVPGCAAPHSPSRCSLEAWCGCAPGDGSWPPRTCWIAPRWWRFSSRWSSGAHSGPPGASSAPPRRI